MAQCSITGEVSPLLFPLLPSGGYSHPTHRAWEPVSTLEMLGEHQEHPSQPSHSALCLHKLTLIAAPKGAGRGAASLGSVVTPGSNLDLENAYNQRCEPGLLRHIWSSLMGFLPGYGAAGGGVPMGQPYGGWQLHAPLGLAPVVGGRADSWLVGSLWWTRVELRRAPKRLRGRECSGQSLGTRGGGKGTQALLQMVH